MNGEPRPESLTLTGDLARQLIASAPPWARAMAARREPDGRIVLFGESDGCYIWVQPKAWSNMTLRDSDAFTGATNYGLNMGAIGDHAGKLETNDARFGRELLGAGASRAGSEVPLPDASPRDDSSASPGGIVAAAIVALGLVAAALIARFRRSR